MSESEDKIESLLAAPIRDLFTEYSNISSDVAQNAAMEHFIEKFRLVKRNVS